MWGALSDERTGLSFTISAGPRQRSHSGVRVPFDSWPILLSQIRDSRDGRHRLEGCHFAYISFKKSLLCNLQFVAVVISFQQWKWNCVSEPLVLEPLRSNGRLLLNVWERVYLFVSQKLTMCDRVCTDLKLRKKMKWQSYATNLTNKSKSIKTNI
jgi:hypothetical protein